MTRLARIRGRADGRAAAVISDATLAARPSGSESRHRGQVRSRLLIVSVVLSGLSIVVFGSLGPGPLMGSRSTEVSASIAVLDRGGPPLLAADVPYHNGIALSHLRPVGVSDDQGIYLYLPVLAEITGEHNPDVLMQWLFVGSFAFLILVYPFLFYELFSSEAVAVVAPLAAAVGFGITEREPPYWVLSWCMLICIPGLVLAYRWWSENRRRAAALLLSALTLIASFTTSMRLDAGLPILLGALGIALLTGGSWRAVRRSWRSPRSWGRLGIAVVLLLGYLSISTIAFTAVRAYRDHVIHDPNFGSSLPTQHPFWHGAYLGLGYLPNRYGIEFHDSVAFDAVLRARPGTGYLSKEYSATLRHLVAQIARNDPGFVLRGLWAKTHAIVSDAVAPFWLVFVLLPPALLVGRRRRLMRVALLVAIPALALGGLAPVLTDPRSTTYELGWLGTWGALFLLVAAWGWVTAFDAAKAPWPADLAPLRHGDRAALPSLVRRLRSSRAAWAALGGALLAALLLAAPRPNGSSSAALYASSLPATVDPSVFDRPGLRSWAFARSLPAGWSRAPGAFTQADQNGLYVRSPMTRSAVQLAGPLLALPAGSYELVTLARSLAGGYQVGVETAAGKTIGASGFSWHQADVAAEATKVAFVLRAATRVRPVVSSWSSVPNACAWVLRKMKLLPG